MEKTLIASGKTIELAKEAALTQLGLTEDDLISYEVLSLPKAGFLGFGAQPAKVMVKYEVPDPVEEKPKSALGSASRSKPKAAPAPAPKKEEPKVEAPKPAPVKTEAPKPEKPKQEKKPAAPKQEKPKAPKAEKKPAAPKEPKVYAVAEPGSVEEKIETFLKGLLENMGSNAVPHAVKKDDNTYDVELTGEDLGYLIGRRGDTLDAIQRLCNYAVNHGTEGRIRISVDAEDYRAKREDSLRKYARKKAQQVLKARRRCSLEPMNAYERHVIHATLQEMENITTYSTGTEPNRRVVIEYVR
jgi:spoIIIJ-associated protein